MEHTVTILHLSDLHARGHRADVSAPGRRATQEAIWLRNLDELLSDGPIDLVCFTGDLAHSGKSDEYEEAGKFLKTTLQRLALSDSQLFLIPGNHDIDRGVEVRAWQTVRRNLHRYDDLEVSRWLAGQETPFGFTDDLREKLLRRQAAFQRWLTESGWEHLVPQRSPHGLLGFRSSLQLPGRPFDVHVIGLDSAWLCGDDSDKGRLRLTEGQVMCLSTDRSGRELPGLRLALVHHALADLVDETPCRRILSGHVDMLLRGQHHEPYPEFWTDPEQSLRQIVAGSLYEGDKAETHTSSCVVIRAICNDLGRPQRYELRFRTFSARAGCWIDDCSLYQAPIKGRLTLEVRPPPAKRSLDAAVPSQTFVGRQSELRRLADAFLSAPGPEPLRPVVLIGPGGVGKSTLARQFFYQHSDRFPGGLLQLTLSIGDTGPADPQALCQRLADQIGLQPAGLPLDEALRIRLRKPRSLLLLEGVDSEAAARVVVDFVGRFLECPVVITARLTSLGRSQGWLQIPMGPLAEEDALALLSAGLPGNAFLEEEKRELVSVLGYSPLAIRLAAGQLRHGQTPSGFLHLLKQGLADLQARPPLLLHRGPSGESSLPDIVHLSLARLQERLGTDAERLFDGFLFFACLPAVPVGSGLGAAVAGLSEAGFEKLMSEAHRMGFIEQRLGGRARYRLHPYIARSLLLSDALRRKAQERQREWFLRRLPQLPVERAAEQRENWDALRAERESLSAWLAELPVDQAPQVVRIGNSYAQSTGPFLAWAGLCQRGLNAPGISEEDREPLLLLSCILLERVGQTRQAEQRAIELCVFADRRKDRMLFAIGRSQLAVILAKHGQTEAALHILRREVIPVYAESGDLRSFALAQRMSARILVANGRLDEALHILRDDVAPVFKQSGDFHSYAETLAVLADIHQSRGQLEEAFRIRRDEVLPIYDRLGDIGGRAETRGSIADFYQARGLLDEALRIRSEEELPVFERLGNNKARSRTLGKIAAIHEVRGQLDEALRIYETEVLPVCDAVADIRERALVLKRIASILQSKGQLHEALLMCREEVLPLCEKLDDARLRAATKGQIADVYRDQGRLDEALRVRLEEELPTYEKLGDIQSRAVAMGEVASIYQDKEEFDKSLQIRETEELPVYEKLGLVREKTLAMARIAGVKQRQRKLDESERILLQDVLPVFEKHGYLRLHAVSLRQLAGLFKARGRFDEAVELLESQVLPRLEPLRIAPPLARARYLLAQSLLLRSQEGDRERARDELEKAYSSLAPQGHATAERIRSLQLRYGFLRTSVLPLKRVLFENIRSITRLEVLLHPRLTVLYGRNAAGKTTVLDALALGLSPLTHLLLEEREGGKARTSLLRMSWPSGDAAPLIENYCRATLWNQELSWSETLWRPDREPTPADTDQSAGTGALVDRLRPTIAAIRSGKGAWDTLPVVVYYGVERAIEQQAQDGASLQKELRRLDAVQGALDAQSRFQRAVSWFYTMEARERKERESRQESGYRSSALEAVRRVIEQVIPGCRNPRMSDAPERLVVDFVRADGSIEVLDLGQLSDGYRTHLALVLDLARRMVQANPPPPEPQPGFLWGTEARAIVLIDEIDLHLHPAWQQTVLPGLLQAFPNAQFIVTTHSDQVLSSCPVDSRAWELDKVGDKIALRSPKVSLPGASSEQVLVVGMEVPAQPKDHPFVKLLTEYAQLVYAGRFDEREARELRDQLDQIRPDDPGLYDADAEIERRRLLARMDWSPRKG